MRRALGLMSVAAAAVAVAVVLGSATAPPVRAALITATASGRVTAPDGAPLAGIPVFATDEGGDSALTGLDGTFTFSIVISAPRLVEISAAAPDGTTLLGSAYRTPGGTDPYISYDGQVLTGIDIQLRQGYPIDVTLLAADGTPNPWSARGIFVCRAGATPVPTGSGCELAPSMSTARATAQYGVFTPSRFVALVPAGSYYLAGYASPSTLDPKTLSATAALALGPGLSGACTLRIGGAAACTSSGTSTGADADDVADAVEDSIGDGNGDGTPDRQQGGVASLPAADGRGVTIAAPAGAQLLDVSIIAASGTPPLPASVALPLGVQRLTIGGLVTGAAATVELRHGELAPRPNTWWALQGLSWSRSSATIRSISPTSTEVRVVDGGAGDLDGVANGSVYVSGGLAVDTDVAPPVTAYAPLTPARLLDTRGEPGLTTVDGQFLGIGLRAAGTVTELQVAGRGGVPSNANAVTLNIAVTGSTSPGYVTAFPCGSSRPTAANLNHASGQTVPNNVVASLGTGGTVCLFTYASTHLVVDVGGYFGPAAGLGPVGPARLLDTRQEPGLTTIDGQALGQGIVGGGSIVELQVTGRASVPADATTAFLNVAVTGATSPGFLTIFPCGSDRPNAASLNYAIGDTIANGVVASIGTGGKVCIFSYGSTHVVVDVGGYLTTASTYRPLIPARLLESRTETGLSTVDGQQLALGLREAGTVTELQVTGRAGVPADATAAVLNVAVIDAREPGFVTAFPCGTERPTAANLNYDVGDTIPNGVIAKIGSGGKVCLYVYGATHVAVDVNGYVAPSV